MIAGSYSGSTITITVDTESISNVKDWLIHSANQIHISKQEFSGSITFEYIPLYPDAIPQTTCKEFVDYIVTESNLQI